MLARRVSYSCWRDDRHPADVRTLFCRRCRQPTCQGVERSGRREDEAMNGTSTVLAYYDALHKSLEHLLFISIRSLLNEQSERLPAGLVPQEDERVLDVACGKGEWVRAMAHTYPAMEVVGLDASEEAIRTAQCLASHLPNARFLLGDMRCTSKVGARPAQAAMVTCSSSPIRARSLAHWLEDRATRCSPIRSR